MNNRERGEMFAKAVGEHLAKSGHRVTPEFPVSVGSKDHKKNHKFDFGNADLLVECKAYSFATTGRNTPSARISTLNEAMLYFHSAPASYKKKLYLAKTEKSGMRNPATLAGYYVRLHSHFIPDDVEVWELDEATLQAVKVFN